MSSIAHKYMDSFIIETNPTFQVRHNLTHILNKIESINKDIMALAGPNHVKEIRTEIMDNWEVLSVHNVLGMMVEMSDEDRQKVEDFTYELLTKNKEQ